MTGPEILRTLPGTPYVLNDEGRGEVWQFMFDYFFEHPTEKGGKAALYSLVYTEFEPDTDRLIEFLKVEKDPGALSKAIKLLRKHVTKDDERLLELIPTVTEWLTDEATLDAGTLFIGMLKEYDLVQLEEPYATAFYPYLYENFMTMDDDDLAWEIFCTLYFAYQDKILAEWGAVEIERMLEFIMEFGDSPAYIYILNELSQRNKFDLSFYVSDIVRFIPQPIEYEESEDALYSVDYYLDILVYISTENPGIINENLKQIYDRLTTWVGQTDLDSYASIITNLENAGITISPDLRELE